MERLRVWAACGLVVLALTAPVSADIIRNRPSNPVPSVPTATEPVQARLVDLGVDRIEADQIVGRLRPEEIDFFSRRPQANAIVGQEETIVMFWYEWVFSVAWAYAAWRFWDTWGCDQFFPDGVQGQPRNCK